MRVFLKIEIQLSDEEYSSLSEEEMEEKILDDAVYQYHVGNYQLLVNPINKMLEDFEYYFEGEY